MIPHVTYLCRARESADLDRALARMSALETAWRFRRSMPPRIGEAELLRRYTSARVRLHEAFGAHLSATRRDTRWTLAMRRARRTAARGRK